MLCLSYIGVFTVTTGTAERMFTYWPIPVRTGAAPVTGVWIIRCDRPAGTVQRLVSSGSKKSIHLEQLKNEEKRGSGRNRFRVITNEH